MTKRTYVHPVQAAKELQSMSEEEERDGRSSPMLRVKYDQLQGSGAPHMQAAGSSREGHDAQQQPPTPRCHKWLEEIETDVLRTCPGDKSAVEDAADEFDAAISRKGAAAGAPGGGGAEVGDGAFGSHPGGGGGGSARVRFSITDTSFGDSSGGAVVEMSPVAAFQGAAASAEGGVVPALAVSANGSGVEAPSGEGVGGASGKKLASTGGGTRDKLRRMLRAFAVYNRRVSYCQVRAHKQETGAAVCDFFFIYIFRGLAYIGEGT